MSDKWLKLSILIIIFFVAEVNALSIYTSSESEPLCPSTTSVIIDILKDPETELTIAKEGTASPFTYVFPYKNLIYSYVTPNSKISPGTYNLIIKVSNSKESKSINHKIQVLDCQDYELTQDKNLISLCPCGTDKISINIKNNGKLTDTYNLKISGEATNNILLSENKATLNPDQEKILYAYIQNTCNIKGEKEFTLIVTPEKSKTEKSITSKINVQPCYQYSADIEKNFIELCENSKEEVKVAIKNEGTTENNYKLTLQAPFWANLDKTSLKIPSNNKDSSNMILSPPYNSEGTYKIKLKALSEKGNFELETDLTTIIKPCIKVLLDIKESQIELCSAKTYPVTIQNLGQDKEFRLELISPEWVELSPSKVNLKNQEERELILSVSPKADLPPKDYKVRIRAYPADTNEIYSEDELIIKTIQEKDCYKAVLKVSQENIELYNDASIAIPVIIENLGQEKAKYQLSLSGPGSEFTEIVPLSTGIDINPGNSEQLYAYITPSLETKPGTYDSTINVRLENSDILDSKSIIIKVKEPENNQITGNTIKQESSIFQRLSYFFNNLFSKDEDQENINSTNEINISDNKDINKAIYKIKLGDGREVVFLDFTKGNPLTHLTNPEELIAFKLQDRQYSSSLDRIFNSSVNLFFSPGATFLNIESSNSREIDITKDNVSDLLVSFNGFINGKANLTYEMLEGAGGLPKGINDLEENLEPSDKEDKLKKPTNPGGIDKVEEKGPIGKLAEHILRNKSETIMAISVLLVLALLIKFNFFKKITKFFEEDKPKAEEEVVTQKPEVKIVKEEEPKPETPKIEKKDDDDDEEFEIIH